MKKFENSKIGTEVYNSKIGKGTISRIEEHRIITVHNKKTFVFDLDNDIAIAKDVFCLSFIKFCVFSKIFLCVVSYIEFSSSF